MTLSRMLEYINTALDFPSLVFDDIKIYLDQAISELNSALSIQIRSVDDLVLENSIYKQSTENVTRLDAEISTNYNPEIPMYESATDVPNGVLVYYDITKKQFGGRRVNKASWVYYDRWFGIAGYYPTESLYEAVAYATECIYVPCLENPLDLQIENYIPKDWILLFIIPYICSKYCLREESYAGHFTEEFQQGFQQLQITYDIPHTVLLKQKAGNIAYSTDVKEHLPNLDILVPVRAIEQDMQIPRNVQATFGGMHDRGGWGV